MHGGIRKQGRASEQMFLNGDRAICGVRQPVSFIRRDEVSRGNMGRKLVAYNVLKRHTKPVFDPRFRHFIVPCLSL
jgi:hypothetical protein